MILAAPLVIPFAQAVGLSVGTLGMAALADKVNDYIQANPEESMKILSTIIPNVGIGQIFMSKEDKISLEDLDDMTDEEAQDLTKEEKAELMKQAGKSGGPNKRQTMIDISEKLGLSGSGKEKQDIEYEIDERYDEGGVEEVSKPKFDYKKFFRKRRADGGAIGVESLFEEKVPAAPSQLVEESEIVLGYRGPGGYQGGRSSRSSRSGPSRGPAGGASAGGNYGGNRNPSQTYGGSIFRGGGGGPKPGTGSTGPAGGATRKITPTVSQTPNFGLTALEFAKKYNPLNFLFGTPVAAAEMTQKELIEMGAMKPGIVYGYNLTDQGKALEDFREVATKFKNAPQNTANTPQAALDFITDPARTGVYGKSDIVKNKEFIQSAIDKGFLADEKDYGLQKPLDEYLADGGRVGFNLGGLLTGQAKSIYDNMMAAGYFTEDEIRNAITTAGYEIPDTAPQPETTQPNIIGTQLQEGGGGGGVTTPYDYLKTYTKDLSGDPRFNYLEPTAQANKYRFDRSVEPRKGLMGFFDNQMNKLRESKFFQPKIKGTLGTRIANRPKLPLPSSMFAFARSPFNPDSPTYNPLIEGQLNFLEGSMPVTRTTGQFIDPNDPSKGYRTTTGDLIGRDPNTGLLKYGSGSVLAGKNVMSLFGTNDYEQALMDYITKMKANTRISKQLKTARLADAAAELKAIQEKQAQDMRAREASTAARARAANPDVYARADKLGFTDGRGGGFASRSTGTNEAFSNKTGRGRTGYFEGGLASMFAEKR